MSEKIELTLDRYQELIEAEHMLACLKECGVDNWSGYGDATDMYCADDLEDDAYWIEKARKAEAEGFLSKEEINGLLSDERMIENTKEK